MAPAKTTTQSILHSTFQRMNSGCKCTYMVSGGITQKKEYANFSNEASPWSGKSALKWIQLNKEWRRGYLIDSGKVLDFWDRIPACACKMADGLSDTTPLLWL